MMKTTQFYADVLNWVGECNARLLVLDSSHNVFTGNENIRSQVQWFVQQLRVIAQEIDGAVVLLSHPSVAGVQQNTGASGSTGWNNSVRSRLYFKRPKAREGEPEDPDLRELKTMKANYGRTGSEIRLRWKNGVFVVDQEIGGVQSQADGLLKQQAVLDALRLAVEQKNATSLAKQAGNYVGKVLRAYPGCMTMPGAEIERITLHLIAAGRVKRDQPIGRKADRKLLVSLTPADWVWDGN